MMTMAATMTTTTMVMLLMMMLAMATMMMVVRRIKDNVTIPLQNNNQINFECFHNIGVLVINGKNKFLVPVSRSLNCAHI